MQLLLSVLFIVYLKIKFDRTTPVVFWLSLFFYIKLPTDIYGILNYTSWISTILNSPYLTIYRTAMALFEVGMITSLFLYVRSTVDDSFTPKKHLLYFILAALVFPINWVLIHHAQSDLLEMFVLVKIIWIGSLIYLIRIALSKPLIWLLVSMVVWNALWLTEVVLHQLLNAISEPTSWMMFITSEILLTVGLSYFLIQVIARPRILKVENLTKQPQGLLTYIEDKLRNEFEKVKLYKDPDLSVTSLAEVLNIPTSDLRIYLNRVVKKNFNQYIIDFRIEESKRILENPVTSKMNIEQVMLASGFNSKSVFNTIFKQKTGLTPSQFRKYFKIKTMNKSASTDNP